MSKFENSQKNSEVWNVKYTVYLQISVQKYVHFSTTAKKTPIVCVYSYFSRL
jgi:hypothetical protein